MNLVIFERTAIVPKVLVVDDSPMDRRLAGGLLERNAELEVRYASDGAAALAEFDRDPPDIVVTDLQMPEMDGLELVAALRTRQPLAAVVIMTAYGSEDIAVEALEAGAASYVPKSQLARSLLSTVEKVLAVTRADERDARLLECLAFNSWTFELEPDASLIRPLVDHLQRVIVAAQLFDETERIRIGVALEEGLLEAFHHRDAGSGPAPGKIEVQAHISRNEIRFVIRTGKCGPAEARPMPHGLEDMTSAAQRGTVLMHMFMDEAVWNAAGDELTLVKRVRN